jgi:hypothetical protein
MFHANLIDAQANRYVQVPFPNGTVTNFLLVAATSTSYHLDAPAPRREVLPLARAGVRLE